MTSEVAIDLNEIDPEDTYDVLLRVEKSFDIKFVKNELVNVKTFDELCDVIVSKIHATDFDDCTTQQAFYKLRNAIGEMWHIVRHRIHPDTDLTSIFPRKKRRQHVADLEERLGFRMAMLYPKDLIIGILVAILGVSLLGLYWQPLICLFSLSFSIVALNIANRYGREFKLQTVGELAEMISTKHYFKSRRDPSTVNRNEVVRKVRKLFCEVC